MPLPSHSVTVSARPTSSMSERARCAPRWARSWASARPMPDPAPVMAATRPVKSFTVIAPLRGGVRPPLRGQRLGWKTS